jgi:hypothetical protein
VEQSTVTRVWHDAARNILLIDNVRDVFPARSLTVVINGDGLIEIWLASSPQARVVGPVFFNELADSSGAGFASLGAALAYLQDVFARGQASDGIKPYRAGSTLSGHRVVRLNENGEIVYASANVIGDRKPVVGLTLQAGISGSQIDVCIGGVVHMDGWGLIPSSRVYLGNNGSLTQMQPSYPSSLFSLTIGDAVTANDLFVEIDHLILLNGA